jgi:predicted outer membrane repeat protein
MDILVGAEFLSSASEFIRYVTMTGAGDGSSWSNASDDVQKMMDELAALPATYTGPRIVKLGAGTYKPKYEPNTDGTTNMTTTPLTSEDSTFILRKGVQVWGGYTAAGEYGIDEATRKSRFNADGTVKSSIHEAVLSGDLNGNTSVDTGDAYHVVLAANIPANSGTVLNGLTISGGYADGSSYIQVGAASVMRSYGGGITNHTASPELVNVTISNNKALSPVVGWGGGIFNVNFSSPTLRNVTISGNSASNSGGGMFNHGSSPTLSNVTISNNTASGDGGGISNRYESSPVLVNVAISNNEVTDSGSYGGGMYNHLSSLTLLNVTISDNHATGGNGGGIGMYNSGSSLSYRVNVLLVNVKISGNTAADGSGGGIYSDGYASSHLVLVNTLISGNMAHEGGGMHSNVFQPELVNVTISGNKATNVGGGIFANTGASPVVKNSIIWGNMDSGSGPNITNGSTLFPISYSIVGGSSGGSGTSWSCPGATDGGGNVEDPGSGDTNSPFVEWKDPSGAPTTEGIYSLKSDSPAIGVGAGSNGLYPTAADEIGILLDMAFLDETAAPIDAALLKDLGGNIRKQGTIDIGAYER